MPRAEPGVNIALYAQQTNNAVGERIYARNRGLGGGGACGRYPTPDEAQRAFLAAGGPAADPRNLDPDGDGFACALGSDALPAAPPVTFVRPIEAPSPNFGPRRGGAPPDIVVLHYTAMASAEAALARLRDPAAEVSAHWLVAEDGRVWRLVDEAMRAWHAGAGAWGGVTDVNSRSIGIELANAGPLDGFPPFPEPQMAALEAAARRDRGALANPAGAGDRAFRHGAGPQGRSGAEVRLAPAGARRAGGLGRGGRARRGGLRRRFARRRRGRATRRRTGDWDAVLAAFRLRFRPWAAGALDGGRRRRRWTRWRAAHPCVDAAAVPT